MINVSWEDAQAYVGWLSRESEAGYRLSSEAEWEYVARARSETAYSWGNDIGRNRANSTPFDSSTSSGTERNGLDPEPAVLCARLQLCQRI